MKKYTEFGARLRKLRLGLGDKQQTFADRLNEIRPGFSNNFSVANISSWENGNSKPSASRKLQLDVLLDQLAIDKKAFYEQDSDMSIKPQAKKEERVLFGKKLASLRNSYGETQEQFGQRLNKAKPELNTNISQSHVCSWENARQAPRGKNLEQLIAFIESEGINAESFFAVEPQELNTSILAEHYPNPNSIDAVWLPEPIGYSAGGLYKTPTKDMQLEKLREFISAGHKVNFVFRQAAIDTMQLAETIMFFRELIDKLDDLESVEIGIFFIKSVSETRAYYIEGIIDAKGLEGFKRGIERDTERMKISSNIISSEDKKVATYLDEAIARFNLPGNSFFSLFDRVGENNLPFARTVDCWLHAFSEAVPSMNVEERSSDKMFMVDGVSGFLSLLKDTIEKCKKPELAIGA